MRENAVGAKSLQPHAYAWRLRKAADKDRRSFHAVRDANARLGSSGETAGWKHTPRGEQAGPAATQDILYQRRYRARREMSRAAVWTRLTKSGKSVQTQSRGLPFTDTAARASP